MAITGFNHVCISSNKTVTVRIPFVVNFIKPVSSQALFQKISRESWSHERVDSCKRTYGQQNCIQKNWPEIYRKKRRPCGRLD
ncbi:unnamed protein product [Mycena citricolor]|uniref:Uncharacterized protein n=1 Tax=Mycena citricolor TaxID=2018698 RepID=A0AAD2HJ26_9AGAR|nr:unnamed protein product [Mycena citricolor]